MAPFLNTLHCILVLRTFRSTACVGSANATALRSFAGASTLRACLMKLSDFDYELPKERIAQRPLADRDASGLLLVERGGSGLEDREFRELPDLLRGEELLVV